MRASQQQDFAADRYPIVTGAPERSDSRNDRTLLPDDGSYEKSGSISDRRHVPHKRAVANLETNTSQGVDT